MKISGVSVSKEIQNYVASVTKDLTKSFNKKLSSLKCDVNRRMKYIEEKVEEIKRMDMPNKCEDFVKAKMSIVRDLESALQYYSEDATDVKSEVSRMALDLNNIAKSQRPSSTVQNTDIDELKSALQKLRNERLTNEEEMKANIEMMNGKIAGIDKYVNDINTVVSEINQDLYKAEDEAATVKNRLDGHDQYSRRNSLLVHGLTDVPTNCSELRMIEYACQKINSIVPTKFSLSPFFIETAHVLATRKRNNRSRVIVVKFKLRWMRNLIVNEFEEYYSSKKFGVKITEHLYSQTMKLLKLCEHRFGKNYAWTREGVVYVATNEKPIPIRNVEHFHSFCKSISNDRE